MPVYGTTIYKKEKSPATTLTGLDDDFFKKKSID